MRFIIEGKVKPAVRMTQRTKWTDPNAAEYLACKVGIGIQLKAQMARAGWDMLPKQTPLAVRIELLSPVGHIADLDNYVKCLCDSAQGIVFHDDRWVDALTAERRRADDWLTVLEVETL